MAGTTKKNAGKRGPERPMSADELVHLDNVPDKKMPDSVRKLVETRREYLSAEKGRAEPDLKLKKERGQQSWSFDIPDGFFQGRIGKSGKELPTVRPKTERIVTVKPMRPNWSGISYHPKLTSAAQPAYPRKDKRKQRVPEKVFGSDQRQIFYPSGYPWRCTGKIYAWTDPSAGPAWVGSGALVGPNVVLTASHVVPWGSSPWMMKFVPAFYDGNSIYGGGYYSYVQSYQGYRNHGQGDDMAVLKLYTALGNAFGWFGTKTYNSSWEDGNYWTRVGWATDLATGNRPNRVMGFPIVDDDWDGAGLELEYKSDSNGGDSGGPVFSWWSDGPYIVGAHSGWEQEIFTENNVAAGGSILPSLVQWAHANW